ncbi:MULTISPECIES: response regulator transcription factor [Streptomyces]|nr:response regulator transcription factor [Streptomyces sp. NP10]RUP63555.1 Transcriptional regulatory protein AfsQ1 [Streptomyces sp. NP10]
MSGAPFPFCSACYTVTAQYLLDQRIPASELVTVRLADPAGPPAPLAETAGRSGEERARPPRLLLVEDDEAIQGVLQVALTRQGYEVLTEATGRAGLRSAYLQRLDLVLLDVMLPDIDGMEVLRRLRTVSDVPVIYLTARSDPIDVIVGLETGADDYIVKPCGARELNARIRRVLFRYRAAERREGNVYDDGLLRLDSAQQQAWTAGSPLPLSRTEFRVLDRLARHAGAVQHFGTLLEVGWGTPDPGSRDRIKFTVSRLRGKLDTTPVGGGSIVSVRGMGYLYRSPTAPALPTSPKPVSVSTGYSHTHALRSSSKSPQASPGGGGSS